MLRCVFAGTDLFGSCSLIMVEKLIQRLRAYDPGEPLAGEQARDRAAVLLPIINRETPCLVLTERSGNLGSHAGEVAWPGGKQDLEDGSLLTTALRESHEEIALPPEEVTIIAELRPFISKFGLLVTPFVGLIEAPVELKANPDELAAIFEVPLAWLQEDPRTQTDIISRHGETHEVPVYHYDGFRIWGLTAMILWEFMVNGMGVKLNPEAYAKLQRNAAKDWETK